jgi:hypothetical protein
MPEILFWIALTYGIILCLYDYRRKGELKKGIAASPFFLLLAAAVAKYVGI